MIDEKLWELHLFAESEITLHFLDNSTLVSWFQWEFEYLYNIIIWSHYLNCLLNVLHKYVPVTLLPIQATENFRIARGEFEALNKQLLDDLPILIHEGEWLSWHL